MEDEVEGSFGSTRMVDAQNSFGGQECRHSCQTSFPYHFEFGWQGIKRGYKGVHRWISLAEAKIYLHD